MDNKYSFLQEKIKDEAGSPQKVRRKILRISICSLLVGVIACFGFFASKPWIEQFFQKEPEEITIPLDEEKEVENQAAAENPETDSLKVLNSLQGVAKETERSMVTITGTAANEDGEKEKEYTAGVILADNGNQILIVAQTLEREADKIQIRFCDGEKYSARIEQVDGNLGLAIYSVKKSVLEKSTMKQLQIAELANSYLVKAGDTVIVQGSSSGELDVVSFGLIASVKEQIEVADRMVGLIRADASGSDIRSGIMLNADGQVLALIQRAEEGKKLLITGYSISEIKTELELLSNGNAVPYLGIYGATVTEELQAEGIPAGVYVKDLETDSPAMEAGIQRGDIITQMQAVNITDGNIFWKILAVQQKGAAIKMKCQRIGADGKYTEIEFKVVVGAKE